MAGGVAVDDQGIAKQYYGGIGFAIRSGGNYFFQPFRFMKVINEFWSEYCRAYGTIRRSADTI